MVESWGTLFDGYILSNFNNTEKRISIKINKKEGTLKKRKKKNWYIRLKHRPPFFSNKRDIITEEVDLTPYPNGREKNLKLWELDYYTYCGVIGVVLA